MKVPDAQKRFNSARRRLLLPDLKEFLQKNVPQVGGADMCMFLAEKLYEFFSSRIALKEFLQPGQMLWTAVDKRTRPDSKNLKTNTVILTLITDEEIQLLTAGKETPNTLFQGAIARMLQESYKQGSLLSMRDLSLIFKKSWGAISSERIQYEKKHNIVLPSTGSLQDMGSCLTHKKMILRKILIEKKEMRVVRSETCHTQAAIDRYLKDYRRVELLLDDNRSLEYISKVTGLRNHLVKQYDEIYYEDKKSKKVA